MKLLKQFFKIVMLLIMLIGTVFSIFTIVSAETKTKVKGGSSTVTKGVWVVDEITGDMVCMGTGTECDQIWDDR